MQVFAILWLSIKSETMAAARDFKIKKAPIFLSPDVINVQGVKKKIRGTYEIFRHLHSNETFTALNVRSSHHDIFTKFHSLNPIFKGLSVHIFNYIFKCLRYSPLQ